MTEHHHASMDRHIFNLNLSVEATSAYIIVTSLAEENAPPTLEALQGRWSKSSHELDQALEELLGRNILQQRTGPDKAAMFYPNPSSLWR